MQTLLSILDSITPKDDRRLKIFITDHLLHKTQHFAPFFQNTASRTSVCWQVSANMLVNCHQILPMRK